jgi:thiol-disulfide isomerase/thioredoxin
MRLSLAQPSFAALVPYPGLSAVYFIAGSRNGAPLSSILVVAAETRSLITLQTLSGTTFTSVEVPLTNTPPTGAELFVRYEEEGAVLAYSWRAETTSPGSARLNRILPPLEVIDLTGHKEPIATLEPPVVVINWWSTWCAPCVEEIPHLSALAREYASDTRVVFVAVSPEDALTVRSAFEKFSFAYSQRVSEEAATVFGETFPRHLVLDRQRRVILDAVGYGATTVGDLRSVL